MPEISRFLGIVIGMFYGDHAPPHIHAVYGEFEISVEIESGAATGRFPGRALAHVLEWTRAHRVELLDDWRLAREGKALRKIPPLE